MISGFVRRAFLLAAVLLFPVAAFAQEAVLTGTVTDSSGAVLPGVTVTATNETTGNTFLGVTLETGSYRIPVRVGMYRITAELSGFSTAARGGIQMLVGQTATLNLHWRLDHQRP